MTGDVHISSLVVQFRPDQAANVHQAIEAAGGKIPVSDPVGKLVAVIETPSESGITKFAETVGDLPGVLSANLVYHQIDTQDGAHPASTMGDHP